MDRDSQRRKLIALICEDLPFNITILRADDYCSVKDVKCQYCSYDYKCTKDTYVREDDLRPAH